MSVKKIINSTLINIDSSFRTINPKHIYESNNKVLKLDPIKFTKNSNIIRIFYENHNISLGDNITIQNVEGIIKILNNSIYLINNFNYAIIKIDNEINSDYLDYTSELYMNIDIIENQIIPNFINNIPFNSFIGIKKCYIYSDVTNNIINNDLYYLFKDILNIDILTNDYTELLNKSFIFISIDLPYINNNKHYYVINNIFKISYLHINGIKLGNLNANYPINNFNYQNSHVVYNVINNDEFEIILNYKSYNSNNAGGKYIQIYKIINTINGYPNADKYVINLKKTFNNISKIELVSMELPYTDIVIKKDINDKLYWMNIEDSDYIYSIQLEEGFYTSISLLDNLKNKMNNTKRKDNTNINEIYNIFDIILDTSVHKIIFRGYNIVKLPNCLSLVINTINNEVYYILSVNHPNNILQENDSITISNVSNVTIRDIDGQIKVIDGIYFNKTHQISNINIKNNTYDIVLDNINKITTNIVNYSSAGGENISIKFKTKTSFLFNKNDTLGEILGFRNINTSLSITDFKYEISNQDLYINTIDLNSVGNDINYPNGFLNLNGKFNYILMYLNDIEYIYNNNNLPSSFAKILLSGTPGDILFNTYVKYPDNIYSSSFPINTLTDINVLFLYPDGTNVNFRNINHSFVLKITEEKLQNDDTYLNSKIIIPNLID